MATPDESDPLSPTKRKKILERDQYACRNCGGKGLIAGGNRILHVHHRMQIPEDTNRNDPVNLITVCRGCHGWIHKRPTRDDAPVELHDDAAEVLYPQHYQILRILYEDGPLTVDEQQDQIATDLSKIAISDHLWKLMGLDNQIDGQTQQLLDKDAETDEWGRPADIETSERGRIPDDERTRERRIEDEQIRRTLEAGLDRQTVADIFDVRARTTRYKERRARAYDFPLGNIETHDHSPTDDDHSDDSPDHAESASERNASEDPEDMEARETGDAAADTSVTAEMDSDEGDRTVDSIDAPVGFLNDHPFLIDEAADETPEPTDDSDPTGDHQLLLTVGLDDLKRDAILRHCISQEKSLSTVLEEQIQQFAAEVIE